MVDNSEGSIALVVEDDPWIRLLLRDLLTDEGYAALEASNGSAALRLAERQPPALVLLDLVLPEQSGVELLTELTSARTTAYVPVIAVSARADLLARAAELADAVVAKAFDIEELWPKSARSGGGHAQAPMFRSPSLRRGAVSTLPTEEECKSGPFPRHLDPARQWQTGISNPTGHVNTDPDHGSHQAPSTVPRQARGGKERMFRRRVAPQVCRRCSPANSFLVA